MEIENLAYETPQLEVLEIELEQAVMCGREYLHQALISGQDVTLGRGHGPVNHFFNPQKLVKNA